MKKIAILGSTGSIGTQTLEVVRNNRRYRGGGAGSRLQYPAAGAADPGVPSETGGRME